MSVKEGRTDGGMARVLELSTHVKGIGRGTGKDGKRQPRSATGAAAYRSGTVIECEMEGRIHDYTRKRGIEASGIRMAAGSPEWAEDRARLWNHAEQREQNKDKGAKTKHKANARTARECMFAFPAELSAAGRLKVAEIVAQYLVDKYGVAVDFSLHHPGKDGDEKHFHCHLTMTTRRMTADGLGEKVREFDDLRTGPIHTKQLRAFIAKTENDELAAEGKGHLVHVEYRSFYARGSGQVATKHQGPVKTGKLRTNQQRARAAWQSQQRHAQNDTHAKDRAALKMRQDFALQARLGHLAERERAGIKAIRDDLAKAQAADTGPTGASRVFQAVTGRAMREDFARQTRHVQRAQAAAHAIEGLKREIQAERNSFVTGQHRDRDALTERHGRDEQQFKQAVTARQQLDRAAEVQARREQVQGITREREGPGRERGPGNEFSP